MQTFSAHDVAAAYCLAMAEVRVRLPLGALDFSVWESLGIRVPRTHEIVGSNPTTLTDLMRWVLCWYGKAAVNRRDAGSIPATAAYENGRASQLAMAPRSNRDELHGLEGSIPSPSA